MTTKLRENSTDTTVEQRVGPNTGVAVNRELDQWAREINDEYALAKRADNDWREHARRIGDRLNKVKRQLGYGKFMPWVEEHCSFSHSLANLYMKVARDWDKVISERVPSLRQAKRMLATRDPESARRADCRRAAWQLSTCWT